MTDVVRDVVEREYQYGFSTDLDTEIIPKGLNEEVVRLISAKNDEPAIVFDPPWTVHRIPMEIRLELGLL